MNQIAYILRDWQQQHNILVSRGCSAAKVRQHGTVSKQRGASWTYPPEGAALPSIRAISCLARPGRVGRGPAALLLDPLVRDPPLDPLAKGPPPMLDCIS